MTKTLQKNESIVNLWVNQAVEGLKVDIENYLEKSLRAIKEDSTPSFIAETLVKNALENIDEANPDWTYVAARIYLYDLYRKAAENRGYEAALRYGDFHELIQILIDKGIYTKALIEKYTPAEIAHFGEHIQPERDRLFTYLSIYTLATRYLAVDHEKNTYELPQERWMIIAMHLMQDEPKEKRAELVKETYWALSNLYMTVATPTMNNAGKTHGQLSSCFIDTVEDSLQGIYDTNTDVAKLSKNGGGIGVYMGKVRGRGSAIKGFKGMSSGVVPWIKIGRAHV